MKNRVLFVKPPDRFLENEFVYQQLGPHYLQSFLAQYGIYADLLVLYESDAARKNKKVGTFASPSLDDLNTLHIKYDGSCIEGAFDKVVFEQYDIVGLSVMSPQAADAYLLSSLLNKFYSHITTVIGGSHPRYYLSAVASLAEAMAFDFIVPNDGWWPMYQVSVGEVKKGSKKSQILNHSFRKLADLPAPTRPKALMEKYSFNIAGVNAYHTITALGCPFSCHFCESGREKLRKFSIDMIDHDLFVIAATQTELGHKEKAVMFFDDVGLMNPKQVEQLALLVAKHKFTTWRAFSHAYLIVKYQDGILDPFKESGGKRIGLGIETGSQNSLNLINKQNGKQQNVNEHYEAIRIANEHGIAVDAFTMIYPWEDEDDLKATTELIKFVAANEVKGVDELGRTLKNHVDSTIMTPFQGTAFFDMINLGELPFVKIKKNMDPGLLYYKGNNGSSGWPYTETRLSKERYEEEQNYRNSFRPQYR